MNGAWEQLGDEAPEALTTYYPFHRDFRELTHEIMEWTEQTEAALLLRDPSVLTGLHNRRFTLDGEPIDTREFLSVNDFDPATLLELWKLEPGGEYLFGGGAAARFLLRREDGIRTEHLRAPRRRLAVVEPLPARRHEPAEELELSVRLAYLNEDLHPRSFTFGRPPFWDRAMQTRAEALLEAEVEGWAPLAAPLAVGYLTDSYDQYPTGTVVVRANVHWNEDTRIWLVNRYDGNLREWRPLVWDEKRARERHDEQLSAARDGRAGSKAERCPAPAPRPSAGTLERCPSVGQRQAGSCGCMKGAAVNERCPAPHETRQRR